jgi:DNA-3-methyladenine glycosylase
MFQQVGLAYVYFIYGNHYCLNATARGESAKAGAVLLRALQPLKGIPRMTWSRGLLRERVASRSAQETSPSRLLTNGPGKLAEALEITRRLNGLDLTVPESELLIREDAECTTVLNVESAPRIGVSSGKDRQWRFYLRGNEFVSRQ